jgi:hypothetical protein
VIFGSKMKRIKEKNCGLNSSGSMAILKLMFLKSRMLMPSLEELMFWKVVGLTAEDTSTEISIYLSLQKSIRATRNLGRNSSTVNLALNLKSTKTQRR